MVKRVVMGNSISDYKGVDSELDEELEEDPLNDEEEDF